MHADQSSRCLRLSAVWACNPWETDHATSKKRPQARPAPSHQRALLRNLASALFLTERDAELDDNQPKVKGRIITTLEKAKEARPLRRALHHDRPPQPGRQRCGPGIQPPMPRRNTEAWKAWRKSDQWTQWNQAIAPAVAARRRVFALLGDKQAVRMLFDEIAPRFVRSPRRLHAHPAAGQASPGRCRHPRHSRAGGRPRSRGPVGRCAQLRGGSVRRRLTAWWNFWFQVDGRVPLLACPAAIAGLVRWSRNSTTPSVNGLDFTAHMRRLCEDLAARLCELAPYRHESGGGAHLPGPPRGPARRAGVAHAAAVCWRRVGDHPAWPAIYDRPAVRCRRP